MYRLKIAAAFFFAIAPNLVVAGQIDIGDFSPTASVQDFEILGSGSISYISPLLIGADSYDGNEHLLRSSSKFGETIGTGGTALSNSLSVSSPPVGFVDIVLGNPALRTGLYVGLEFPWAADVEFYDVADNLLGMTALSGNGGDNDFAAWQATSTTIKRVRVTDVINNGVSPLIIDDFIQEVPEPISACHFLIGLLLSLRFLPRLGTTAFGLR